VWSGAFAFAALTAALGVAVETVKPEWRDPEFGYRFNRIKRWRAEAPDRPLVVLIGSSRTQMAVNPVAMGFPDAPGSPLVYNLGYRAAPPVGAYLHLSRLLDAGIKPRAVLVQLAPAELGTTGEGQLRVMDDRLELADLGRLAPYVKNPWVFRKHWAAARLNPWTTHHTPILGDLLPSWCTPGQTGVLRPEASMMNAHGYVPCLIQYPEADRPRILADIRHKHDGINHLPLRPTARRVFRDLVERCHSEGIAVAFFWAPESPEFRSWYRPEAAKNAAGTEEFIRQKLGCEVFPGPVHLAEGDFADGYHLLRPGAEKYSRWLAEQHLKPWLTKQELLGK
jgi:hypothetical protein